MWGDRDPIFSRRPLAISRRTLTIYAKIVSKQLVKGNIFIYRTRMGDRGPGSRSPGDFWLQFLVKKSIKLFLDLIFFHEL